MRHLEPSGVLNFLTFEALLGEFSGFNLEISSSRLFSLTDGVHCRLIKYFKSK